MFSFQNQKKISILLVLAAGLVFALTLSMTHNHLVDQGQLYNMNCPLCSLVLGFLFCAALGIAFAPLDAALWTLMAWKPLFSDLRRSGRRVSRSPPTA